MAAQQPTYQAYTVVKREGQDDFWLSIGAAFMHQDGDGYNIILQALPINGKIVRRLCQRRRTTRRHSRRHERTRGAIPIAIAAEENSSLKFRARQQCLRLKLKPRQFGGVFHLLPSASISASIGRLFAVLQTP
jgi:hypothetical protein